MKNWKEEYKKLNDSFDTVMVYRMGIDAGFFTEYAKMIRAMLYCLQHHIKFKLYTKDANFSYQNGWTDFFVPFTEEVNDDFHQIYNRHRTPSWQRTFKECLKRKNISMIIWKLKVALQGFIGHCIGWKLYGKWTLMNQDASFDPNNCYCIPELEINGGYRQAFSRMIDITWELNEDTKKLTESLKKELNLPLHYIGMQARGGDKIIEMDLMKTETYFDILDSTCQKEGIQNVFLLTDDYTIYKELLDTCPQIKWFTLCTEKEKGYVNREFSHAAKELKETRMKRFLVSMQILMEAEHFIGTITTGPCMFLFKYMYPHITVMDYDKDKLDEIIGTPIEKRVELTLGYH